MLACALRLTRKTFHAIAERSKRSGGRTEPLGAQIPQHRLHLAELVADDSEAGSGPKSLASGSKLRQYRTEARPEQHGCFQSMYLSASAEVSY